ncbi:MAG: aldehyde ferredoxin oxidoreductase family protein [Candidatus Schekmanbacteria bacterium]|nr:aldehyde ferredoxin oxidoreductase family protein [Candidatus Schekmanbacteria bacterium]
MKGWTGKILRINLTESKCTVEPLNEDLAKKYIGGRGIASKMLLDEIDATIDPLSPDNKLFIMTGPLTGTGAPCAARFMVVTKSPQTGTIACSNSGGYWGPELKAAGFDGIILEGKSPKPIYIWINNDKIELKDASELWGMNTHETTKALKSKTDHRAKVACIGPAGEKLVLMAAIINDMNRSAARSGVGAVMGSKNVKAIAVRGTKGFAVADGFRDVNVEISNLFKGDVAKGYGYFGTPMAVDYCNAVGIFPTNNYREGVFAGAPNLNGQAIRDKILVRKRSCHGCVLGCGRVTRVKEEGFEGTGEGPEYETIYAFGSTCGIDNINAVAKANYICNELGMDSISVGVTIATAMELFELGLISEKEVGMPLKFGDAKAMVELTRKTGLREGFGDLLALGSYRLAEKYGRPELSMTSKKMEISAYDPRGAKGMALTYSTNPRGGDHTRGATVFAELFGIPKKVKAKITEGKAELARDFQNLNAAIDSTGACLFATVVVQHEPFTKLISAATGHNFTLDDYIKAGERIFNVERLFNVKAGFTRKDDSLPPRVISEPMSEGPSKGETVDFEPMLTEYYALRGWDNNGVPTKEKISELGI